MKKKMMTTVKIKRTQKKERYQEEEYEASDNNIDKTN